MSRGWEETPWFTGQEDEEEDEKQHKEEDETE